MDELNNTNDYIPEIFDINNYVGLNSDVNGFNSNTSICMPTALQAQPHHMRRLRSHAAFFPLNTMRTTPPYSPAFYYEPVPGPDGSMDGQSNTPSRNRVEAHENCFCRFCGFSNGYSGTIKSRSIVHTFAQMRTGLEYEIIREVRIQLVIGRLPANANFGEVSALTQQF